MAHYIPNALFSVDTNPKTLKGQQYGFMTAVLYMAPARMSGINLCAMAEIAQCDIACLNTAGNPAFSDAKTKGRYNKARYFIEDQLGFMRHLAKEIFKTNAKVIAKGFNFLCRLNGTTDIRWELISVDVDAKLSATIGKPVGVYKNIFALFPEIQFYDYTKIPNRKDIPSNYDLTFSYSGVIKFQPYVNKAIASGMRIAVVFRTKASIPTSFNGMQCIDGDDSDIRHLDPQGVVVALYAKGKAKKDMTGFVVDAAKTIQIVAA
jgi:hypothetical protein